MDFVGRYENLESDFASVCRRLGINAKLELLNVTGAKTMPLAAYYDSDTVVRRVQDV